MESHLKFNQQPSKTGKTTITEVISCYDESLLGIVKWYAHWRQYCFFPNLQFETLWSWDCLEELTKYIKCLNEEQKRK